jgi:hypothetical protein
MHTFTFGKSKHPMFSDNAAIRMREAMAALEAAFMPEKGAPRAA